MPFTNVYDQQAARNVGYPNAEDQNFLGYRRVEDRWKVDASGTWTTPSGAKIVSASGTPDIPVYITSPMPVSVAVDIETDSIKIWSASGSSAIETWVNNESAWPGSIYSKTMTMANDSATRFETSAKKLNDIVIAVETNPMLLGKAGAVDYPMAKDSTVGFTMVDISTLYFKNAGAGNNGKISILGVEQ